MHLQLGSLSLPLSALLLFAAWWLGTVVQERFAKRHNLSPGSHAWVAVLCALAAARAGFVLAYWEDYRSAAPGVAALALALLDIRDGGWQAWWGLAGAGGYGAALALKRSPWARGVLLGMAAGVGCWLAGQGLMYWSSTSTSASGLNRAALPHWQGINLGGQTLDLSTLSALSTLTAPSPEAAQPQPQPQPIVINLWASWCPPCRREMPAMLQAQARHPQVRFLWVNQGESAATVLRFAQQHGLPSAQVLLDPDKQLGQLLQAQALPSTYFYRADGQLAQVRVGEVSAASLRHYLTTQLGQP